MNVVPGLPTQFAFTPTITTADMRSKLNDPTFDYILLCNKICGGAHYRMKMKVIVHTASDYEKWMSGQAKFVQNAAPDADTTSTQTQVLIPAKNNKTLASK
jgi:cytochrome c oxidase subunit 2